MMVPDDELAGAIGALTLPPTASAARDALLAGRPVDTLQALEPLERTPAIIHLAGLAHLLRGDLYRAADAFQAASDADPTMFEALYRLGRIQALREEHDRAIQTLRAALEQQPDHAGAIAALAECHTRRGDPAEAENLARRGLVFAPESAALHIALAAAMRTRAHHAEAVPVLERALELAADDVRVKVALGRSLLALERPVEARPLFEQVLTRNAEHIGALAGMAEALEVEGRLADAHGYVLRALAAAPDRPGLHVTSARIHLRRQQAHAAEDAALMALTLDANHTGALRIALRAATMQRGLRRAARFAQTLRGQIPDDAEALAAQALATVLDGQLDTARATLGRAREATSSPDAQRALGVVELAAGRADAAARHLTEALRLRGDDPFAQQLLERAWEAVADPDLDVGVLVGSVLAEAPTPAFDQQTAPRRSDDPPPPGRAPAGR